MREKVLGSLGRESFQRFRAALQDDNLSISPVLKSRVRGDPAEIRSATVVALGRFQIQTGFFGDGLCETKRFEKRLFWRQCFKHAQGEER